MRTLCVSLLPTKEGVLVLLLLALLPLALPSRVGLLRRSSSDSFHQGVSCAGIPFMVAREQHFRKPDFSVRGASVCAGCLRFLALPLSRECGRAFCLWHSGTGVASGNVPSTLHGILLRDALFILTYASVGRLGLFHAMSFPGSLPGAGVRVLCFRHGFCGEVSGPSLAPRFAGFTVPAQPTRDNRNGRLLYLVRAVRCYLVRLGCALSAM